MYQKPTQDSQAKNQAMKKRGKKKLRLTPDRKKSIANKLHTDLAKTMDVLTQAKTEATSSLKDVVIQENPVLQLEGNAKPTTFVEQSLGARVIMKRSLS